MKKLITEEKIKSRIKELGKAIQNDYQGKSPVLIGVMKGSFIFTADLARSIDGDVKIDFIEASSYGESTISSGNVRLSEIDENRIKDKDIILVEDIVDSGLTLNRIYSEILLKNPASLKICALLVKKDKHEFSYDINYIGFEIEDRFVIGYGLDYKEKYRNLPYISVIED
ncbi:MAG: hypoxanthine phosphoribosyltransferase [Leptospiraceae bacterium]|nr:hypoxanthine phosphoribosyltransferase [Leptospiraceae bacterium]